MAELSTISLMIRWMSWILVALTSVGAVMAQCELEARLLRVAEGNQRLAMMRFQQAEALVVQYETLAESQPLLEQLLASSFSEGSGSARCASLHR